MTYAHFAADFWTWVTDMSENVAQTNKLMDSKHKYLFPSFFLAT